jgi:thiol-disulfide isomerase/thioredoxin
LLVAALAAVLSAVLLAACGAPHLTPPPPAKVDVAAPDMVAMKAKSKIEDCPKPETTDGPLPKVTLACLGGGRSVDLSTLKGPLVINLWQADCTPCRKEMPALETFHREYGDRVPILGIDSTDVVPGVALRQAISRGVTYPLVADPGSDLQSTSLRVRQGFPTFYILGADGKLTYHVGGLTSVDEVKKMVEQALGITL